MSLPFFRKGEDKFPVRSSYLPLNDGRQQLRELGERTECYACGRKGHCAHDYECTMSPFSLFPVSGTPDTHCSYDDKTTPFQPTEKGHKVFRSR